MGKLLLSLLDNGFKNVLKLYLNSYFPKQLHEKYDFRNSNHLQYCEVLIIGTKKILSRRFHNDFEFIVEKSQIFGIGSLVKDRKSVEK